MKISTNENPWLSIWCEPRSTISRIVAANPNRSLWILAFIYGFLSILNSFQSISVGNVMGIIPILLVALIISPLWGYAAFSIWSWVVCKIGKLLKGEADFLSVRAAFAWSCVPLIINIAIWFLMIFFVGAAFLFSGQQVYPMSNQQSALLFLLLIGKVVIAIWSLVIYLNALAEVQKFSILRAIFNVIISWIVIGIVVGVICFFLMHMLQNSQR
jgi:hypothetical protein